MASLTRARQDQANGLGCCRNCGHEYKDSEVRTVKITSRFFGISTVATCPKCHKEDQRTPYWCNRDMDEPLHAPSECEKFHYAI